MLPIEALEIWSNCCAPTNIRWYLYAETLLCAKYFHTFPNTLNSVQIAILAEDLPIITNQIFPSLPYDWKINLHEFVTQQHAIAIQKKDVTILELHVLCPVETLDVDPPFSEKAYQIRTKTKIGQFIFKAFNRILPHIFQKHITGICQNIGKKAFNRLLLLAQRKSPDVKYYCDYLTNKSTIFIPQEHLLYTDSLFCDNIGYPVFFECESYLREVYGDYEEGLFDEIGCGLTTEEKNELKIHQQHCREALAFIQALSDEFNLRYYLLAGSVLGCVRHSGFIPWDDDIDIGIRIEDLSKFETFVKEYLPKRLPEGFSLMQPSPNFQYPRMFSKICYKGRCCVDLWPLIPTYNEGLKAEFLWYFAKITTKVHYKKIGHQTTGFRKIVNTLSFFLTDKTVLAFAKHNERRYVEKQPPAYINLYSIYSRSKETIPRSWLDEKATAKFIDLEVPIVGCTDLYLTHLYGDYMIAPPPWKRTSYHVDRFFEKT